MWLSHPLYGSCWRTEANLWQTDHFVQQQRFAMWTSVASVCTDFYFCWCKKLAICNCTCSTIIVQVDWRLVSVPDFLTKGGGSLVLKMGTVMLCIYLLGSSSKPLPTGWLSWHSSGDVVVVGLVHTEMNQKIRWVWFFFFFFYKFPS